MLNIYEEPLENPEAQIVSNSQSVITEICATSMHTIDADLLHNEQKVDKMCKKLVSQIHGSNKINFMLVTLSADGILQKHHFIHLAA